MGVVPIVKTVVGLLAIGGIGGASYFYKELLFNNNELFLQTYLIQLSSKTIDNFSEKFICEFEGQIDEKCSIFSLNFGEKTYVTNQEIFHSQINKNLSLTKDSFYKLEINKRKINKSFINKEIKIKKNNFEQEEIASFKILVNFRDVLNKKWNGLKMLVQAQKSVFETSAFSKCKINPNSENTEDISCKIYEFNDLPSHKNSLDFSKIKEITDLNKVQSGRYYIIDFSDVKDSLTENHLNLLNDIEIIDPRAENNDGTTKTFFTFIAKIISHVETEESNYSKNKALIFTDKLNIDDYHKTYIIAKGKTGSGSGAITTVPKNYQCLSGNDKKDPNCELIELKDNERTLSKINFAENLENSTAIDVNSEKFFKIVVNNEIINSITKWDGTEEIKIVSSDSSNTTEYKKLTPLFFIENGKTVKGKTNLFIVNETIKSADTTFNSIDTWNSYKCELVGEASKAACDIYKFAQTPNTEDILASLTSSTTKVTQKSEWKNNDFYLINYTGTEKIDFSKLISKDELSINIESQTGDKSVATSNIAFTLFNSNAPFDINNSSKVLSLSQ